MLGNATLYHFLVVSGYHVVSHRTENAVPGEWMTTTQYWGKISEESTLTLYASTTARAAPSTRCAFSTHIFLHDQNTTSVWFFGIPELKACHGLFILSKDIQSEVVSTIILFICILFERISWLYTENSSLGKINSHACITSCINSCLYYWGRGFVLSCKVYYAFWLCAKEYICQ